MNNPSVALRFKFQLLPKTKGFLSVVTLDTFTTVQCTETNSGLYLLLEVRFVSHFYMSALSVHQLIYLKYTNADDHVKPVFKYGVLSQFSQPAPRGT